MLLVDIKNLLITDIGFVLFLRNCADSRDGRVLPIFIGSFEAQAISLALSNEQSPRPLPHKLMFDFFTKLDKKIKMVVIDQYKDTVFYATIHIDSDNLLRKKTIEIDARPSDAIALAIQCGANIYVKREIFETCAVKVEVQNSMPGEGSPLSNQEQEEVDQKFSVAYNQAEQTNQQLGFYQKKLHEAIKKEHFEEAANLRDKIATLINNMS